MPISHHRRSSVVLSLGIAQTLGWGSTYYLPAILAAPMARDFAISTEVVYGFFSAAMLLTAFIGPMVGHRIDRFGGRQVLSISSLIFALGLGLIGLSPNIILYGLGWMITGLGMAMGLYEAGFATLTAIYGSTARNAITGITLLAGFASTVCWPISALIESEWGWRAACLAWAAAHLVIGLPIHRFLIPTAMADERTVHAMAPKPDDAGTQPAASDGSLFTRPMLLMAFVFAATWITSTAMAAHLPRILEMAGATRAEAVAAASLVGPAQVAARFLEFSLLRRLHPLLSARLATITHPIGAALVLLFGAPAAYLFTILHGAGNGVMTIAKGTLPLAIFGPVGYGRRQGWLAAPTRFGQAFAPLIFALLLERFGTYVLIFSSALCLSAGMAMLLLRGADTAAKAQA